MGIDHKIIRTSENFKGLDLSSSDLSRGQDYSSDMRNAVYTVAGAITKRKGFKATKNVNSVKGMTTYKNVKNDGSIVDELIFLEDNEVKKLDNYTFVGYKNDTSGTDLFFTVANDEQNLNVAVNFSDGIEDLYTKTFPLGTTISSLIEDITYKSNLPLEYANELVPWNSIDMSQARIRWQKGSTLEDFDDTDFTSSGTTEKDRGVHSIYIPVESSVKTDVSTYYANTTSVNDSFIRYYSNSNTQYTFKNGMIKFADKNLLMSDNVNNNSTLVDRLNLNELYTDLPSMYQTRFREGYFESNGKWVDYLDSSADPLQVRQWMIFDIHPFSTNCDPNHWVPNGTNKIALEDLGGATSGEYVNNLYNYKTPSYEKGSIYNHTNYRWVFSVGLANNLQPSGQDITGTGFTSLVDSPSNDTHDSITLQNLLTNFNSNINNLNTSSNFDFSTLEKLPFSSVKTAIISLEVRDVEQNVYSGALNIEDLEEGTSTFLATSVSSNPSVLSNIQKEAIVGTLDWTSADYDDIETENASFATLNDVLYIANGVDNLKKYDGEAVYRAGIPPALEDDFTLTQTTSSSNGIFVADPLGVVESIDADYDFFDIIGVTSYIPKEPLLVAYTNNSNWVDGDAFTYIKKYRFKIESSGLSACHEVNGNFTNYIQYSYASLGIAAGLYNISGSGLEIEVILEQINDTVGSQERYLSLLNSVRVINEGTGYTGQDFFSIVKEMFYRTAKESFNYFAINASASFIEQHEVNAKIAEIEITSVTAPPQQKTFEYRFAFEYTDFKGNVIVGQPSEPKKVVVPNGKSITISYGVHNNLINQGFNTTATFDSSWQSSTGVTLPTSLTDNNYPVEKLSGSKRLRLLIFRSKGYDEENGEVVGQFYKIADKPLNGVQNNQTFIDTYRDEASSTYAPTINPFLNFVDPIKRKDLPPKGKYLTVFKNCLVISGQKENVNNLQYSLPKNFATGEIGSEYFPDDDNAVVVESPFGSKITAITALTNFLIVFHKDSIFSVSGNINELELPTVDIMTKEGGLGCVSNSSIEEFNQGIVFLSDSGVFSINSSGIKEMSSQIRPLFNSKLKKDNSIIFNWVDKNLLVLCIPKYVSQGDIDYIPGSSETNYIDDNSLILAYDYNKNAWIRWDNLEFKNGISMFSNNVFFVKHSNEGQKMCVIKDNNDQYDYSDLGSPIDFYYETNWESLGDPTVPKKFLRLKLHSFDTEKTFETPNFKLDVSIRRDYIDETEGTIEFDFGKLTGGGWGNFRWGMEAWWGSAPLLQLKSKLPSRKSKCLKLRFENNTLNQNVLITNYEMEIAAPFRQEIKD